MILYDKIRIPRELHKQMQAHLEPSYPHEGCGIMIGSKSGKTVDLTRVVGAENQNKERGHDRFEIDPLFYFQTEKALTDGEHVLGFFHSHPDCPEVASETDRTFALNWPDFVWVIYRVDQGTASSVRSWILDDETDQWSEMIVEFTD